MLEDPNYMSIMDDLGLLRLLGVSKRDRATPVFLVLVLAFLLCATAYYNTRSHTAVRDVQSRGILDTKLLLEYSVRTAWNSDRVTITRTDMDTCWCVPLDLTVTILHRELLLIIYEVLRIC